MKALVVAEHNHVSLKVATLHAIAAANCLGAEVHVLVAGFSASLAAAEAAKVAGVGKVLHADSQALADGLAENMAEQVLRVAGDYGYVVFAATSQGKNIAPRVAARLDVDQLSDVTCVLSADTFKRPIYAGNAIATVQSDDPVKVITVRTTAFDAAGPGGDAPVESVPAISDTGLSIYLGAQLTKSGRPDLASASIVVSGGRALGSSVKFDQILTPLANVLNATVGASRAAVDSGYASNDMQVGQTGKIVAPQLYVAIGISGAIQHLAGMKDSKVIVAINNDPDAPIFNVADYGLVGDLFVVVPQLVDALHA